MEAAQLFSALETLFTRRQKAIGDYMYLPNASVQESLMTDTMIGADADIAKMYVAVDRMCVSSKHQAHDLKDTDD